MYAPRSTSRAEEEELAGSQMDGIGRRGVAGGSLVVGRGVDGEDSPQRVRKKVERKAYCTSKSLKLWLNLVEEYYIGAPWVVNNSAAGIGIKYWFYAGHM